MTLTQALQSSAPYLIALATLTGLMVGSFLNVVIYRLPLMMQAAWRKECHEYLELADSDNAEPPAFNLCAPGSHCPHCKTAISPLQNIPLFSYIALRGRCAHCRAQIPFRYPAIELVTALMSAVVAWKFGYSVETILALLLTWSLISLSLIDLDHQLLPDSITLPMLWVGLSASVFGYFTDADSSIIGAVSGYLCLWTVYQVFKMLTGKEGMGFGDFKLLAMLGAWLGWQALPLVILLSSLTGAVGGIALILLGNHQRSTPIPFGPFLAAAGWIMLVYGDTLVKFSVLDLF